jgi:hypothetical protein
VDVDAGVESGVPDGAPHVHLGRVVINDIELSPLKNAAQGPGANIGFDEPGPGIDLGLWARRKVVHSDHGMSRRQKRIG